VTRGLVRQPTHAPPVPPVAVTSPAPASAWNEIIDSAPRALPTQTRTWLECVCDVDGYEDASRIYETADRRRLVLPLVRRRIVGRAFSTEAGLPVGWGPGGLVGEGGVVHPEDVRMVAADLARGGVLRVQLRPDPATAPTWEAGMPPGVLAEPRMAQTVFLEGGFDAVWRGRFRSDARTRVRRAERAGVVVERDESGRLVPIFHELYAKSVARWARRDGHPVTLARWRAARKEPRRKLTTVAAMLRTNCRVYVAFAGNKPAAAIVVLFGTTTAAYWRGAMDETLAGRTCANYLLHRAAIEDAAGAGCLAYNMGDSAPGSSLALFKSRFGAVEQHYASYRFERVPITPLLERAHSGIRRMLEQGHTRKG
jgi:Acetyltransferase (GNAT) domain